MSPEPLLRSFNIERDIAQTRKVKKLKRGGCHGDEVTHGLTLRWR